MKRLLSFYFFTLVIMIMGCQKNKEYYVFDDKKDQGNKEFDRLRQREDQKMIDEYLKEMKPFMATTGAFFREDISSYEFVVNRVNKQKSGSDVKIRLRATLMDSDNLRVVVENKTNILNECGADVCQFDFSRKNHEDLFNAFLQAKLNKRLELHTKDIKEDKIKLKVNTYTYKIDDKNYAQVNSINYELRDDFPTFLVFAQRVYDQVVISDGQQNKDESYVLNYSTKKLQASEVTEAFPENSSKKVCEVRINKDIPEEETKSFYFFKLVNCQ